MFKVLRTQIDVVLPDGLAVLNGADPAVVELAELCDGKVIFYGASAGLDRACRAPRRRRARRVSAPKTRHRASDRNRGNRRCCRCHVR